MYCPLSFSGHKHTVKSIKPCSREHLRGKANFISKLCCRTVLTPAVYTFYLPAFACVCVCVYVLYLICQPTFHHYRKINKTKVTMPRLLKISKTATATKQRRGVGLQGSKPICFFRFCSWVLYLSLTELNQD